MRLKFCIIRPKSKLIYLGEEQGRETGWTLTGQEGVKPGLLAS